MPTHVVLDFKEYEQLKAIEQKSKTTSFNYEIKIETIGDRIKMPNNYALVIERKITGKVFMSSIVLGTIYDEHVALFKSGKFSLQLVENPNIK